MSKTKNVTENLIGRTIKVDSKPKGKRVIFTDGACRGNTQKDYSKRKMAWVVTDSERNVLSEKQDKDGGSNNIAEFLGILEALKVTTGDLLIKTDSKNNLAWFEGRIGKGINDYERTKKIHGKIEKEKEGRDIKLKWVPRDENEAGLYIEENYS